MSVSDIILTHPPSIIQRESGSGGPVMDRLLFLPKTVANLDGTCICIFRKNNYCLSLATKHRSEIFSELKEIKQRNEMVEKHKHP